MSQVSTADSDPGPDVPDALGASTQARRRAPWWRWPLRPRNGLTVVALLVATVLPWPLLAGHADPADGVFLPERIATDNPLTTAATDEPAGPALVRFHSGQWEWFDQYQDLVLSVDGHTYRHLGVSAEYGHGSFLAPDGSAVLITRRMAVADAVTYLSLTTGQTRSFPIPRTTSTMMMAWSPDLRYAAIALDDRVTDAGGQVDGILAVLDLHTGAVTEYPAFGDVSAAASSPDSSQLAAQAQTHIILIKPSGGQLGAIPVTDDFGLLPSVAWSPDGRWLALAHYLRGPSGPTSAVPPKTTSSGSPMPAAVAPSLRPQWSPSG